MYDGGLLSCSYTLVCLLASFSFRACWWDFMHVGPDIPRRDCLSARSLSLWLLPSFSHKVPWDARISSSCDLFILVMRVAGEFCHFLSCHGYSAFIRETGYLLDTIFKFMLMWSLFKCFEQLGLVLLFCQAFSVTGWLTSTDTHLFRYFISAKGKTEASPLGLSQHIILTSIFCYKFDHSFILFL